jgi:hypothetical protein
MILINNVIEYLGRYGKAEKEEGVMPLYIAVTLSLLMAH